MKLTILSNVGFCEGVNRSLAIVEENYQRKESTYLLGMIVHNEIVNNELIKHGIRITNEDEIFKEKPGTVITTAHGTKKETIQHLIKSGFKIIDTTCPIVDKNNQVIEHYKNDGFDIVYLGIKNHPESKANANLVHIIENKHDINQLKINNNRIVIIAQTTMTEENIKTLSNYLLEKYPHALTHTKICPFVLNRQKEVEDCANLHHESTDYYFVLGSNLSNNTKKLEEIILHYTTNVRIISSLDDLYPFTFKERYHIYITSGTSTPMSFVREVKDYIEKQLTAN